VFVAALPCCSDLLLAARWLEVLRCISRWELLQQIASGMPIDAVLFSAGESAAFYAANHACACLGCARTLT
jgi:hypothetical protein